MIFTFSGGAAVVQALRAANGIKSTFLKIKKVWCNVI